MDDLAHVLDPPTQGQILRRQLAIVRESNNAWRRRDQLAALMVLWHACFYEEAFEMVADDCRAFSDEEKGPSWGVPDLRFALDLASRVEPYAQPVTIPSYAEWNLWHPDPRIRAWTRECLYWVTPHMQAEELFMSYVIARRSGYDGRDHMALISLCPGALECIWKLRDWLPTTPDAFDEWSRFVACGLPAPNPFAGSALELTAYMFIESMRLRDKDLPDSWFRESIENGEDPAGTAALERSLIAAGPEQLMAPTLDYGAVETSNQPSVDEPSIVHCPLMIEAAWYRLLEHKGGRLSIERHDGEYWWTSSDVAPGAFIAQLLKEKHGDWKTDRTL